VAADQPPEPARTLYVIVCGAGPATDIATLIRLALLHEAMPRDAEATMSTWHQIVAANSWNATATRRVAGASTASS
jgi:hypothetical protein